MFASCLPKRRPPGDRRDNMKLVTVFGGRAPGPAHRGGSFSGRRGRSDSGASSGSSHLPWCPGRGADYIDGGGRSRRGSGRRRHRWCGGCRQCRFCLCGERRHHLPTDIHELGAGNIARACHQQDVQCLVHISGIGGGSRLDLPLYRRPRPWRPACRTGVSPRHDFASERHVWTRRCLSQCPGEDNPIDARHSSDRWRADQVAADRCARRCRGGATFSPESGDRSLRHPNRGSGNLHASGDHGIGCSSHAASTCVHSRSHLRWLVH